MSSRPEQPGSPHDPSSAADTARTETLQPDKVVTVLSVSGSEADHTSLGHLFRHTKWTLLASGTCSAAIELLRGTRVPVVICDRSLPDGDWRDLLNGIAGVPASPLLIVTSRLADDRLWSDVINCGGYDVLEKPFNQSELVRVVSLAWRAWKDRYHRGATAAGT